MCSRNFLSARRPSVPINFIYRNLASQIDFRQFQVRSATTSPTIKIPFAVRLDSCSTLLRRPTQANTVHVAISASRKTRETGEFFVGALCNCSERSASSATCDFEKGNGRLRSVGYRGGQFRQQVYDRLIHRQFRSARKEGTISKLAGGRPGQEEEEIRAALTEEKHR